MKRYAAILILALSLPLSSHAAEVVERILAVVNDEIVTEQDLEVVMAPVLAQYRTMYTGSEYEEKVREVRQEFLSKVIDDKLILSEAKRKQVIVKDDEVDDMMSDVRNKFPNREAFLRALEDQGITEKKLWNRFRDQLITQRLVSYEVKAKVAVSPGEVNDYYKLHAQDFMQGERVRLQHILIRTTSRSNEEAKVFAEDLVRQIEAGKDFAEIAKAYSEGSEAREGGDMGWMEKGQLMGQIDEQVFQLETGKVTPPIHSNLGYHIFKVVERKELAIKPLSEVRAQIQDILFREKLKDRLENWMKTLKKSAYISIR